MKKMIYISLLFALLTSEYAFSQAAKAYRFSATTDTPYAELSEASVIPFINTNGSDFKEQLCIAKNGETHTVASFSEVAAKKQAGIPLGFDFLFAGTNHNRFMINSDGHIILGRDSVIIGLGSPKNLLKSQNFNYQYIIGACPDANVFGRYNTSVSYKLEGSSPNRVLCVQFSNLGYKTYNQAARKTTDSASFQIRLYETSNKIEICFGTYNVNDNSAWLAVGIHGTQQDVHLRAPRVETGMSKNWLHTIYSSSLNGTTALGANSVFPKDLRFIFQTPLPCSVPTINPSDLTVTNTSNSVTASYTLNGTDADGSIILFSKSETLAALPQKGMYYAPEDKLGDAQVCEQSDNTVKMFDLESNTTYYFHVITYNDLCNAGPVYNISNILKQSFTTYTSAPEFLKITETDYNGISLSGKTNSADEEMIIAYTSICGVDEVGNRVMTGKFIVPSVNAQVGDILRDELGDFAGRIIYRGKSFENLKLSDLESNTLAHYRAWSVGKNHLSTVFASVDTITKAKTPFVENFSEMPAYASPYAWTEYPIQENKDDLLFRVDYDRQAEFNKGSVQIPKTSLPVAVALATPPILFDAEKDVRLSLDILMTTMVKSRPYTETTLGPTKYTESDSLVFEISEDNGLTYKTFFAYTKTNAFENKDTKSYFKLMVPIRGYQGKTCMVRMRWAFTTNVTENFSLKIKNYSIQALDECDFPWYTYVIDSNIVADQAGLDWWTNGDESNWDIRYQYETSKGIFSEWSEPTRATSHPYILKDLPGESVIKAQIRSVCALESVSQWVDFTPFNSGYVLPFFDDFNKVLGFANRPNFLPVWSTCMVTNSFYKDTINVSKETFGSYQNNLYPAVWKTEEKGSLGKNNSARFLGSFYPIAMVSEIFNFKDNKEKYKLSFDAALSPKSINKDTRFIVGVAKNASQLYLKKDLLFDYQGEELLKKIGDSAHIEIDLSNLEGFYTIGFFFADSGSPNIPALFIDNFSITAGCPDIESIKEDNVSDTAATISWSPVLGIEKYIVKLSSGQGSNTFTSDKAEYTFTNLSQANTYTISVAYLCEDLDTSSWKTIELRTLAASCDVVEHIEIKETSQTSIKVSWTGDAYTYELALRKSATETEAAGAWYTYTSTKAEYTFTALSLETAYDFKIKSRCSNSPSDTSEWSAVTKASTKGISCHAPTALQTENISFYTASVKWEGTASAYQVGLKKAAELVFKLTGSSETKTYTVTGLTPSTNYSVRVRAICGAGDTSAWSVPIDFATIAIPECPVPTELKVEDITQTSALLKWSAEEEVLSLSLRHRSTSVTSWNTETLNGDIREFALSGLKPGTAYVWAVKAACSDDRASGWASQNTFTSSDSVKIERADELAFTLYAEAGQIHILNPSELYVYKVEVISATGIILAQQFIRSSGNIIFPYSLSKQVAIIRVYTSPTEACTYKILIK